MPNRTEPSKSSKARTNDIKKNSPKKKIAIIHPFPKREISPDPLYESDLYRTSPPLFPDLDEIEVIEPRDA